MDWIDPVRIKFASTPAIVAEPVVDKDGCEVVLEMIPSNSVVLDVDQTSNEDNLVKSVIGADKRCDFVILSVEDDEKIVALLEVTDDNTNLPEKIYECMI